MLNKVAGGLLFLAIFGYIAGVVSGSAFVYILCFFILVFSILFGLLVLMMNFIWRLLPGSFKKKYEGKIGHFSNTFFLSVVLFYIIEGIIGEILLPDVSGSVILLAKFSFLSFLVHSLIRKNQRITIIVRSIIFVLFVASISFFVSTFVRSGEIMAESSIEKLKSLPYLGWVPVERDKDREKVGVTKYNPEFAFDGLNLYCSQTLPEAYLIDMQGNIIHKWSRRIEGCNSWADHVELIRDGELLVVARERMLIELDWKSNIKWKKEMQVHHDVAIDENEDIYVLAKERGLAFWHGLPVPIVNDYIAVLSTSGELLDKIYIYDLVKEHINLGKIAEIYTGLLRIIKPRNVMKVLLFRYNSLKEDLLASSRSNSVASHTIDLLHTNTLEILNRDIEGFCEKGDWLISIRNLNLVGVLNPKKRKVIWSWGPGEIFWQHHPTLLENGNVLIFDNGPERGFSRVVELDPLTKRIVWEYKSKSTQSFYSQQRGSNQRLPNGNTLITESDRGYVFEITKEGEIVWEFYNPETKKEGEERGVIYRMTRITDPKIYKLVEGSI